MLMPIVSEPKMWRVTADEPRERFDAAVGLVPKNVGVELMQ